MKSAIAIRVQKGFTTAAIVILIYGLPLLPQPALLLMPKLLIVVTAAVILFMSQPALSLQQATTARSTDRNTIFSIFFAVVVGQIVSVTEWAYVAGAPHGIRNAVIAGLGLALMVAGIAFRLWAIRTLGRFFTVTVQISSAHRLVSAGPYRIVRHPSYLGSLVAIIGGSLFLEAPVGAAVSAVVMLVAYKLRIVAEERALVSALGDAYRTYQQDTWKLIPCVW